VVVDDGIATGATARAACQVARAHGAVRVVLAVPVAPQGWHARIADAADELVSVQTPRDLVAIGEFYADFTQTTDEEVIGCLERAAASAPRPPAATAAADDPPALSEEVEPGAGQVRLAGYLAHPRLGAVTAPTLLIVGGHDDVVLDLKRRAPSPPPPWPGTGSSATWPLPQSGSLTADRPHARWPGRPGCGTPYGTGCRSTVQAWPPEHPAIARPCARSSRTRPLSRSRPSSPHAAASPARPSSRARRWVDPGQPGCRQHAERPFRDTHWIGCRTKVAAMNHRSTSASPASRSMPGPAG